MHLAVESSHLGEDLLIVGVLLVIAYIFGRLGKLIGLPAIPIYMLVGLLASPYTNWFPLNFDTSNVELIAIFGLILLLFNLGLEFDQDEFFGNAGKLLISGGSYILVNMGVGFAFGFMLGWGTREALIIAGITATSSSAIVTKLLIELNRLPNKETPMILGVTVVEDIFIAIYLAIVGVVLSGETDIWAVVVKLLIAFLFLVTMFTIARWGGKWVSKLFRTKDDELFTILFFGLAVAFGGIGELLGVTDAIGAFLIGLVLGATKYRARIEHLALPLRDVFGAFFFLNFGLALDISTFGEVLVPVALAVVMTIVLNIAAGQFVAWLNGLGPQAGINATVILQNRGEFALILATLATAAGLDPRIVPFAGLYVLTMSILGPILAVNSERIGGVILRTKRKKPVVVPERDRMRDEGIALVEAALGGLEPSQPTAVDDAVTEFTTQAESVPTEVLEEQAAMHLDRRATPEVDRRAHTRSRHRGGLRCPRPVATLARRRGWRDHRGADRDRRRPAEHRRAATTHARRHDRAARALYRRVRSR
jgi:CPA2 family monovalent cation:H+ antiporter-2